MKSATRLIGLCFLSVALVAAAVTVFRNFMWQPCAVAPQNYVSVSRPVGIYPDYTDTVVPPNIAPLNFRIAEPGDRYFVRLRSQRAESIGILSDRATIQIPIRKWRRLLNANRGGTLYFDIYVRDEDGKWKRYEAISNTIATEDIDSHIAYRLLRPQYNFYKELGIYQRDLRTYNESLILHGRSYGNGCINCHSFHNYDPQYMLLGIRSSAYGSSSLLVRGGRAGGIGTALGHTAWHPSGRVVAFSKFDVRQFFHTAGAQTRDVIEFDSLLGYYSFDTQSVKTNSVLADKQQLETQPTWSPDGRYLYFISAPKLWGDDSNFPPERFAEVKYDLKRVSYDVETDQWGGLETVLAAGETGKSIVTPRISPDGRFLLFSMCDYGCFAIFRPETDLYLMDTQTGKYEELPCNTEFAESWHAWSSNSRWIVFSSKRPTGVFTRLYFSYVDEGGKVHKPFILPQKDPLFYDSFIHVYNVPEFIKGAVRTAGRDLINAVRSPDKIKVDALTGATPKAEGPAAWQRQGG